MISQRQKGRIIVQKDIELKEAVTKKDAEIISALAQKIWTEHYTPIIGEAQVKYMLEKFSAPDKIYSDLKNGYIYYTAYFDGKLAGYTAIKPEDEKRIFLSKLYVDKSYRGNGISRFIINHIISKYKPLGYNSIWLTVNKNNVNSIKVYNKLGFINDGPLVTDIGGGFVMDDYKMTLYI